MTFTEHDDEPGVYGMDVTIGGEHDHVAVQPYNKVQFLALINQQPFFALHNAFKVQSESS